MSSVSPSFRAKIGFDLRLFFIFVPTALVMQAALAITAVYSIQPPAGVATPSLFLGGADQRLGAEPRCSQVTDGIFYRQVRFLDCMKSSDANFIRVIRHNLGRYYRFTSCHLHCSSGTRLSSLPPYRAGKP